MEINLREYVHIQCTDSLGVEKRTFLMKNGIQITPSFNDFVELNDWIERINFIDKKILLTNLSEV